MDEFKKILELMETDAAKAIEQLKAYGKKKEQIEEYRKEYHDLDRNLREGHLSRVQVDKPAAGGKDATPAVRLPINYQKKIVTTAAAWEVGEPVTLIPKMPEGMKDSNLAKLIIQTWKSNRLDNLIYKAVAQKKSETQAAFHFYLTDIKPGSRFEKILAYFGLEKQKREINVALLENSKGLMFPYFDEYGDMIAFVWEFNKKVADKDEKHTWVYTATDCFKSVNDVFVESKPHGFGKIPIVYIHQDQVEWQDVKALIDRREVTQSKLCDSNDRVAYPILKTYGKVTSLPQASNNGKVLNFPMEWDDDAKKHVHGDAEFLTLTNAPEAIKLEMESTDELISFISSTPFMSLSKLMEIGGNIATATLKLMFTDPIVKAKANEGDNRTMIERIINVITAGIVTTTNTKLSGEAEKLYFDIEFNSILPGDLKEAADIATGLKSAGLASRKTLLRYLDLNEDVDAEIAMIDEDAAKEPKEPTI